MSFMKLVRSRDSVTDSGDAGSTNEFGDEENEGRYETGWAGSFSFPLSLSESLPLSESSSDLNGEILGFEVARVKDSRFRSKSIHCQMREGGREGIVLA